MICFMKIDSRNVKVLKLIEMSSFIVIISDCYTAVIKRFYF